MTQEELAIKNDLINQNRILNSMVRNLRRANFALKAHIEDGECNLDIARFHHLPARGQ
jgi:hypothetical protein